MKTLGSLEASFRMSKAHRCDPAAVAVWLRMGEIEAAEIDCAPWDRSRFKEILRQARGLTRVGDPPFGNRSWSTYVLARASLS